MVFLGVALMSELCMIFNFVGFIKVSLKKVLCTNLNGIFYKDI
ncbi:hypothetical protein M23134_02956 [Microscilla marina ATCC 23134]|uniref:Uncharacterized protein n=1 Tax=Microscilla marina ATCC 23134 TaxID=313606 RepID=A1ZSF6_MICM2|nr:hypothetical protein M23134_02956 [Microscilla marina ATCC 23134]